MLEKLMDEYLAAADTAATDDYADKKSVRRCNAASDRMRAIVREVVELGADAVRRFASLLHREPAALWVAHQLPELAELDRDTLSRCFMRVERSQKDAEANGALATAMGEEMWLKQMKAKKL